MSQAEQKIAKQEIFSGLSEDVRIAVVAAMEQHASEQEKEATNILRGILEDTAMRLKAGGPRYEIAAQLEDAASSSFQELCHLNVEIEVDDGLALPSEKPVLQGDPVMTAVYRVVQLRDGIAAIEISGETASDQRHQELRSAIVDLRNTLNLHVKEGA